MGAGRVSVVVAAHDAEPYLAEAIESVLAQTRPALEIVVVDDGSRDGTAEVARRHGARVHRQRRSGPGAARNAGVELASGDVVAFLDADDRWTPDKLERQLPVLAAAPRPAVVLGWERQFVSPELADAATADPAPPRPAYLPGVALLARETWRRVGPFRADVRVGEFMDWLLRLRELGLRDVMLDEVVLHRRIHATNHTAVQSARLGDYAHILKASLDRRRQEAR